MASISATVANAWDLNTDWKEVTVAAFGPGENRDAKNGRILFASGSTIMSTTLEGVTEGTWNASVTESPRNPYTIFDNQIVKLKGGELIYSHEAVTWKDNVSPHPSWWNSFVRWPCKKKIDGTPGETLPGARAIIYFWRSTDAGKTWNRLPDIDAAKLRVPNPYSESVRIPRAIRGLVARPRHKIKDGKKSCSVGGFDGHHLYADPYTGNLFLTTQARYGDRHYVERALSLVLVSEDNGDSWKVCFRIDDVAFWRAPVTSLPTGEVGFVYDDGGVKLAIKRPPYKYGRCETRTVTTQTKDGQENPDAEFNQKEVGNFAIWGGRGIARDRSGGFLVAKSLWADGAVPTGTLTHQIFKVDQVDSPIRLPIRPIGDPIKAENANGDTIHGTLVEGDPSENLAMFYWVDRDGRQENDKYKVKYQLYDAIGAVLTEPGTLTIDEDGNEYAWEFASSGAAGSHFVGDYMAGASFRNYPDNGERYFVAPWSEEGRLRCNIVTVRTGSRPRRAIRPGVRKPTKKFLRTAPALPGADNTDQIGD
jgi:hypothetical protein